MPTIRFTANPKLPRDMVHLGYAKDVVVELPTDACERWLRRGVAVYVQVDPTPEPTIEETVEAVVEPEPVVDSAADPEPEIKPEAVAEEPAPVMDEVFNPQTSPIEMVRDYLSKNDAYFHPRTGEARLREMAAAHLAEHS